MLAQGTGVVYYPTGHLHDLGYCENNPGFGNLGLPHQKTEIMRIHAMFLWRFRDIFGAGELEVELARCKQRV